MKNQALMSRISSALFLSCEAIKRKMFDFEDYLFEKKYGLDLRGIIKKDELTAEDKNSLFHATAYHAVWCRNLRQLFLEATKIQINFESFIDIGSGKGKACFYAEQNKLLSFNSIIGVEFSLPLIDISNKNKAVFKSKKVSFLNYDASQYELPNRTCLVFMFNPFDETILETFISNNIDHFKKYNSVVAYANDIHKDLLSEFGFTTLFRNDTRKISIYQIKVK